MCETVRTRGQTRLDCSQVSLYFRLTPDYVHVIIYKEGTSITRVVILLIGKSVGGALESQDKCSLGRLHPFYRHIYLV